MKRHFILSVLLILCYAVNAQSNVTVFNNVKVDGKTQDVISAFKQQGFKYYEEDKALFGYSEYLDEEVELYIYENVSKGVYRIETINYVSDDREEAIRYFNELIDVFEIDSGFVRQDYSSVSGGYKVNINDSISKCKAKYFQKNQNDEDTTGLYQWIMDCKILDEGEKVSDKRLCALAEDYMYYNLYYKRIMFFIKKFENSYYLYMFFDNLYNKPIRKT